MGAYSEVNVRSGNFLKIEPNKPAVIRLLDKAPYSLRKHWDQAKKTSIVCNGEGCTLCAEGHEPRQTWAANVYSHDQSKVLVFEWGPSVMKILKTIDTDLEKQGIKIEDTDLSVSKSGTGLETKYAVVPRMKSMSIPEGLELHEIDGDLPF